MSPIEIPLSQGKVALIDADALHLVAGRKWFFGCGGYAVSNHKRPDGSKSIIYMHRLILCPPQNAIVDHRNGNRTDNRMQNLRVASHSDNMRNRKMGANNRSGFKGVSFREKTGMWIACISLDGKSKHLGCFSKPQEAYAAYCNAARALHGEFARFQ